MLGRSTNRTRVFARGAAGVGAIVIALSAFGGGVHTGDRPVDATEPSTAEATSTGLPARVTGLRVTAAADRSVEVTWNALDDESSSGKQLAGYLVHVDWKFVKWVPKTETTTKVAGVAPGIRRFEVRGVDIDNRSGLPATLLIDAYRSDTAAPIPPTTFLVTPTDTGVSLSWSATNDDDSGLSGYLIHRDDVYLGYVPADTTTWFDPHVVDGPTTYHVRGIDRAGNYAGPASRTIGGGDDVAPPAPANVQLTYGAETATGYEVTLSWDGVEDLPAVGASGLSGYWLNIDGAEKWLPADTTSYTVDTERVSSAFVHAMDRNNNFSERARPAVPTHP
ncbi:MAG: fibronectin type III domain-containing protein [Microthrixaceae bacterium]